MLATFLFNPLPPLTVRKKEDGGLTEAMPLPIEDIERAYRKRADYFAAELKRLRPGMRWRYRSRDSFIIPTMTMPSTSLRISRAAYSVSYLKMRSLEPRMVPFRPWAGLL